MQVLHEELREAIITADERRAVEAAREILMHDGDPLAAVECGLSSGMAVIGERFEKGECYLPELITAAQTFAAAMKVLEPEMVRAGGDSHRSGVAVVGTVAGDVHTIGKDIFAMLLIVNGFEVCDLGSDVSMSGFLEKAQEVSADLIGMSALLVTTMPSQQEVIEVLCELGIRDRYVVMVGGGPVSEQWAERIGADGYANTAQEGAELAVKLVAAKKAT